MRLKPMARSRSVDEESEPNADAESGGKACLMIRKGLELGQYFGNAGADVEFLLVCDLGRLKSDGMASEELKTH